MATEHELDTPPWLRVETTIMSTARQLRCFYDRYFAELDLNLSQASLLAYVGEFGPHTQTALARRLDLGRAATGTVIDQLEERDLVQRTPNPEDRRVWVIALTPSGDETVRKITKLDAEARDVLRAGLSRQDRQALASVLVQLQQNMTDHQT